MATPTNISIRPFHVRATIGYSCTTAWGVLVLLNSIFGTAANMTPAVASMLPGLVTCLLFLFAFRSVPSLGRESALVRIGALLMAAGTFLCTYPPLATMLATRLIGLVVSGALAIVVVMAWFDVFARQSPRAVIVMAGCSATVSAAMCWIVLVCPTSAGSVLISLLPLLAYALLPPAADEPATPPHATRSFSEVFSAAVPLRTLAGIAVTFFVVSSIGSLAPQFGLFTNEASPLSLLVVIGVSAFFVASARLVRSHIDPTILYKILLSAFAGVVFLVAYSVGISASLLLYANIIADVMMFTVVSLWAKKTPVQPHLVFAIAWVAECVGNVAGQLAGVALAGEVQAFLVATILLILLAVGFAFSEGSLVLDVDFREEPAAEGVPGAAADGEGAPDAKKDGESAGADAGTEDARAEAAAGVRDARAARAAAPGDESAQRLPEPSDDADAQPAPAAAAPAAPASPEERLAAFGDAHGLSPREREVFALWVTGHGLKHIEHALFISEATVKSHLRSIYRKCDTHSRAEIIDLFERESGTPSA